ncbi:MAG TPA: hypothetical protein VMU36_09765 [Spirochaetia bacterium]|nr:hypothetical protein [Spirochaetia bacterium]
MPVQRGRAAAIALFLLPLLAFAQDEELPFPFVSLLTAQTAGYQIKLTWRDSPEKVVRYLVYRNSQEMTAANVGGARLLGQVDPGVQYFVDTPPDERQYFYAVLAQDSRGKIFSTLIPFRNKTLVGVSVTTPATEQQAAARISDLRAAPTPGGEGIQVTFRSSSAERDLLVFRSTAPIRDPEDLIRSTSATQLDAGTTKTVVAAFPGVDYWFAVLDAGLYKLGTILLQPGSNSTTDPVQVPITPGQVSRAPPPPRGAISLPSLDITFGVQSGYVLPGTAFPGFPPQKPVSPATGRAIAALLASVPQQQTKELTRTVLTVDATPSPDAEDALLQSIVKGPFLGADAAASEKALLGFLSLPRGKSVQARAHYYLGQVYYFSHRPQEALLEFLLADTIYYHEAEEWKNACLRELKADARQAPAS